MTKAEMLIFKHAPSMLPSLLRVLAGRKPYYAASGVVVTPIALEVPRVVLRQSHLQHYREVCVIPQSSTLPPAFLHVVAMPLHLQLFSAASFPVKVLGLIHLRNTIRLYRRIGLESPLRLGVSFDTLRVTDVGQEYDFVTRAESAGEVVWEEVSTMFARNPQSASCAAATGVRPLDASCSERRADPYNRHSKEHRLALRVRVGRLQSHSSDRHYGEVVWFQTSGVTWHVVHGAVSGRGGRSLTGRQDPDRLPIQVAGVSALASHHARLVNGRRPRYFHEHAAWRPPASGDAGAENLRS